MLYRFSHDQKNLQRTGYGYAVSSQYVWTTFEISFSFTSLFILRSQSLMEEAINNNLRKSCPPPHHHCRNHRWEGSNSSTVGSAAMMLEFAKNSCAQNFCNNGSVWWSLEKSAKSSFTIHHQDCNTVFCNSRLFESYNPSLCSSLLGHFYRYWMF